MFLTRLPEYVRKRKEQGQKAAWRGLLPPQRMREVLARERARTDRNGDPFSLLTFVPREMETVGAMLDHLAALLKRRLRSTDEIGWIDRHVIGALLPSTPARGAWKVADEICLSFPAEVVPPLCKVYCYPSISDDGDGDGASAERPKWLADVDRPVHALETFFVQPTPPWKRGLDVVAAGAALVLLLPLLAAVALAIKLTSPGPVFFRQMRSGRGGKPFVMYKFRSMVADAESKKQALLELNEQDGPAFKLRADPRVTHLGCFLRATSIDELPQLFNVLQGNMTLVGPRPLPCDETAACRGWERRRLDVTPGVTCTWQVAGRSKVTFAEWVRMDLQYMRSRSLWCDLKLLLQTLPIIVLRRGS